MFKDEQKCVNGTAKSGVGVSGAQAKLSAASLKNAADGSDLAGCVNDDADGKVGKSFGKTAEAALTCAPTPPFGFTDTATINTAARQAQTTSSSLCLART